MNERKSLFKRYCPCDGNLRHFGALSQMLNMHAFEFVELEQELGQNRIKWLFMISSFI